MMPQFPRRSDNSKVSRQAGVINNAFVVFCGRGFYEIKTPFLFKRGVWSHVYLNLLFKAASFSAISVSGSGCFFFAG
jgi:hypothetical protein